MNILFDINHPAHVHLFRNVISLLKQNGHNITVVARDKEVTVRLLENYNIDFILLSKPGKNILGLAWELITRQFKLIPIIIKHKINLCVSLTGASSIYAVKLFRIPFFIFHDSECAELQNAITYPFADKIYTPSTYKLDHGKKHIKYAGFHELAYLHPKQYTPSSEILIELGLKNDEKFFILRFVSWKASHDVGRFGFTLEQKIEIVNILKNQGKIFITSEKKLEDELEPYRLKVEPSKLHDLLFHATMLITDSQTVTTESALLGTPAIRYNSFVGPNDMGNFIELENKYGLIFNISTFDKVKEKIHELLSTKDLKQKWEEKRQILLKDKIDVTNFMYNEIIKSNE